MFALGTGAAQAQVKFETKSTDAVREMAIKQGKLVFIDLYASWCPPCRMMERQVFSRKDVGEFMDQRFVAAKYDTDKTTGRELTRLLNGIKCRINLIRFHRIPDSPYFSPGDEAMVRFRDALTARGIQTTIRASRGEDIQAACGLLSTRLKGGI